MTPSRAVCVAIALTFGTPSVLVADDRAPEFNRDIRPLFAENCFACHGPDARQRKAGLRLDVESNAKSARKSGAVAVVPGSAAKSELIARLRATDDGRMPPAESGKSLTPKQIELLERWVAAGAPWADHWSLTPITRPTPPAAADAAFVKGPIDPFVLDKLAERGLTHAAEADRVTLIRRLSFDLTGLPPTPAEVEAFLNDGSDGAYERVVDRLLASPHYGERMAAFWLDLARYADSVGYHGDQPISVSPFRDYVIRAFNDNKPFDRFTVEQLAGDLLPNATLEQKVASGYNRLGMMSAEGGVQPKEYLAKYIAERVRAVSGAWLGVTLGCAECHDHKFDPFTTRDFYRLEAFFADIKEQGLYSGGTDWGPSVPVPTSAQQHELDAAEARVVAVTKRYESPTPEVAAAQFSWAVALMPLSPPVRAAAWRLEPRRRDLAAAEKAKADLLKSVTTTPVTLAVLPRTVRVLKRGNWMDDTGEVMDPGVPGVLPQPAAKAGRLTRLDLAGWVTAGDNPLTARVLANRLWKLYFGAGLSRKLDDLGAQGDWPTHPELLDFLAGRLIDSGWDVKALVRLVVTSGTYRQSSQATPEVREKDPFNRWLARQGRFRLDAETVRDNALAVSGLLAGTVGGPSVKPYQPPGYWSFLNFPAREWQNGRGDDLYRRGVYTHWQRQYLHPALLAFDGPSREECTAERVRSNTPLQSLVLLNAPEFVEAARVFAEAVVRQPRSTDERLDWAFRRALSRPIRPAERDLLADLLDKHRAEYRADPKAAGELLKVGSRPAAGDVDPAELAAWTSVTRAILNLHASVTRD
ncbi:MAG: PSD1 and planctomycete cytochrome C domain-containing protein [Gemmataceae bacterium]